MGIDSCGRLPKMNSSAALPLSIAIPLGLLFIAGTSYLVFDLYTTTRSEEALRAAKSQADAYVIELEGTIAAMTQEKQLLSEALERESGKNATFEEQLKELAGSVGTLEKLAKTDSELLAKYSKVYFLNENYIPARLSLIDEEYLSDPSRPLEIHASVERDLESMLDDARADDIDIAVASAYRSFDAQTSLKTSYLVAYGSGANRFSADQGYSEHQLGTTVDFTTSSLGGGLVGFETTEAYTWLLDHAHRYGFILSYPKDNAYYQFEPWHWRYVGHTLADDLRDSEKHFYDLDQRDIDKYLVDLFED